MLKPPLKPMLLETKTEPFNSADYLFEFKWDGFRNLIFIDKKKVYVQSRNLKNLTPYFPELSNLHRLVSRKQAVLDGEICFFNEKGQSDFSILQKRLKSKNKKVASQYPVAFITWDILQADSEKTFLLPLKQRKEILEKSFIEPLNSPYLQQSPYILGNGKKLFQTAIKNNFEGIVAKKLNSKYLFKRSEYWQKIKIWNYTEAFICAYSKDLTSLAVIKKTEQKHIYLGKVKTVLSNTEKNALKQILPRLKIKKPSFAKREKDTELSWVKPLICIRIKYYKITTSNSFRHGYAVNLIIDEKTGQHDS